MTTMSENTPESPTPDPASGRKTFRFVTDSTCDIPAEWVSQYAIHVVPAYINYRNQSFADDGKHLVRETYYREISSIRPHPTTAAMSVGDAEAAILDAAAHADHVVIATVSSKLSGVYNAMRLGAQKLPADRYSLFDSGSTSMGLGWQVIIGAEVAQATGAVDAVLNAMRRANANAHVYCGLQTMEYLRRSGRVSWAAANIGALLQIKPMIELYQGDAENIGRVRTFKRALQDLYRLCKEAAPLDRLAVLHANNPTDARELYDSLQTELAPPNTVICDITPAIGTNIGPGAVGVALIRKQT